MRLRRMSNEKRKKELKAAKQKLTNNKDQPKNKKKKVAVKRELFESDSDNNDG